MPKIACLTPTGDRPQMLSICRRWFERFEKPADCKVEWIVVDDGRLPFNPGGCRYIRRDPGESSGCSLGFNLKIGLDACKAFDYVVILEDDDWYSPRYLVKQYEALQNHNLHGYEKSVYYHLGSAGYFEFENKNHSSMFETAFRGSMIPKILAAIEENGSNPYYDLAIWNKYRHEGRLSEKHEALGIKGGPGRRGYCPGHRSNALKYISKDIADFVGKEDAEIYGSIEARALGIAVISCWYNEAKLAKLFLKAHDYADRIIILLDVDSGDGTREILRKNPKVEMQDIRMPNGFDDGIKQAALNALCRSLTAYDWVVAVDSDEFILGDIRKTLEASGNYELLRLKMYDLFRHRSEADFDPDGELSQRTHGHWGGMKPVIVRPTAKDAVWTEGCHVVKGMLRTAPSMVIGTHWRLADPVIANDRCLARRRRLSQNNKDRRWGYHNFDIDEVKIKAECDQHLDDPQVVL